MRPVDSVVLALLLAGCRGEAPTHATHSAPATVAHRVSEAELTTITLSADAARRLGVETAASTSADVPRGREVGGELLAVPGHAVMLSAPVAGVVRGTALRVGAPVRRGALLARLVPLAPADRDLRAQAMQQVTAAQARLTAAEARASRAAQLALDRAGSARAAEEAAADRDVARAALTAARARLSRIAAAPLESDIALTVRAPGDGVVRQVLVAEGQSVAAGAPLVEVASVSALWVRVPVYSGDLATIDLSAPALVRPLSARDDVGVTAAPVQGPPTADPANATSDLYYAIENAGDAWRPGERVIARLRERATARATAVPWSAVVFDTYGGAWVYEAVAPLRYARRRVEVAHVDEGRAVLARGPAPGTAVVAVGAAELFGTEFGAGH